MNETLRQVLAELPEIKRRANKATLGPWWIIPNDAISEFVGNEEYGEFIQCMFLNREGNAEFIAHAREDVPKLCDALQAAADEIERLNDKTEAYVKVMRSQDTENQRLQAEIERLKGDDREECGRLSFGRGKRL